MSLNEKILKNLLCSNCNNIISYSPVYISTKGRYFCGRCEIPNETEDEKFTRDTIVEIFMKKIDFPCMNKEAGCNISLTSEEIRKHEKICVYNQQSCTQKDLENCSWRGSLPDIEEHFKKIHPKLIVSNPFTEKPDISKDYFHHKIVRCNNFTFLLQQKCDTCRKMLSYCVKLLAPVYMAGLFEYTVKFAKEEDVLMENKTVQPYRQDTVDDSNIIQLRFDGIQELGDYKDIDFSLSLRMKSDVNCFTCGQFLDCTTIALADGEYKCLRCFHSPVNLKEILTQWNTTEKIVKRCSACNEKIDTDISGKCLWCNVVEKLKIDTNNTGEKKCFRSKNGCTFTHDNQTVLKKHENYLCRFPSLPCNKCYKNYSCTTWLDHLMQEHCIEVQPLVNKNMATINLTHTYLTKSLYVARINGLKLQIGIYDIKIANRIDVHVVANTQLMADQFLEITCVITGDTTAVHELQLSKGKWSDWYDYIGIQYINKDKSPVINLETKIKIKD